MGSPSRNVQYHPPRLSEDRLNLPQPHSPSLPTHCSGKSGMRPSAGRRHRSSRILFAPNTAGHRLAVVPPLRRLFVRPPGRRLANTCPRADPRSTWIAGNAPGSCITGESSTSPAAARRGPTRTGLPREQTGRLPPMTLRQAQQMPDSTGAWSNPGRRRAIGSRWR